MILQVENISKYYKKQEVLRPISFSVDKGEIVGFLGPNGAGKSTVMKIISGALPPDDGTVRINGSDVGRYPLITKSAIGYLPDNNPLYEDMYIAEYLHYVAGLYPINRPEERIREVIRQTGLTPELSKKIAHLSKGYKQRVGLAQALIPDPDLLLLDEPTAGLDPNQLEEIHQLLLSLSKEKGILFSSHILSEVATICTRILFIHQGEIKADLPTSDLTDIECLFKELTKN